MVRCTELDDTVLTLYRDTNGRAHIAAVFRPDRSDGRSEMASSIDALLADAVAEGAITAAQRTAFATVARALLGWLRGKAGLNP